MTLVTQYDIGLVHEIEAAVGVKMEPMPEVDEDAVLKTLQKACARTALAAPRSCDGYGGRSQLRRASRGCGCSRTGLKKN